MLLHEDHRAWTVPVVYPGVWFLSAFAIFVGLKELGVDFHDEDNKLLETVLVIGGGSAAVYAVDRLLIKR